jgi:tRNA-2-methylthio-N6-dimethylallyladenosine synthase
MPSFYIKTYGCQMNERDSEQVARQLVDRGYQPAADEHTADVILLNTCSVRDQAEQRAIRKMQNLQGAKKRRTEVVLGFMGCMAQSRGGELAKMLPGVDLVVGTQKYHRVADYIDTLVKRGNLPTNQMDNLHSAIVDTADEPGSQNSIRDHASTGPGATAFVSIMQGCNMHCAFCIVPTTRGAERSRPQEDILAEVRTLVSQGVKEVTLLGQIVNLYGRTEFPRVGGRSPFTQLLYALQEIEGLERIRFTSPHPIGYKKDLVQAFRDLSKLCEHVHLPLQSGSDRILKAMGRGYTAQRYRELVAEMREACPHLSVTTDIIVGYPGETEEDYLETKKMVEEVEFDNAFIFRYSPRRDTPAAALPDQLSDEIKEARNQDLLAVLDRIAERKGRELMGQTVEILVEGPSKNNPQRLAGRTRTNKLVLFEGDKRHLHQLLPVRIIDTTGFTHYGDPVIFE